MIKNNRGRVNSFDVFIPFWYVLNITVNRFGDGTVEIKSASKPAENWSFGTPNVKKLEIKGVPLNKWERNAKG